ncbi:MAG TPA: tRNA epoxyqueuosine(34) reductase QueG [Gemmatimonadaceae bacterium]|nr:tRNA epoxyqueuosine(34) reductase QueG [Gemmatimonadaceae bacterium]
MTVAAQQLEKLIKAQAYGLGFDLVGIATLGPVESADVFEHWLAEGRAGEMDYLARGAEKRRDTRLPVDGAKSAIVVGMNYGGREPSGPVARYARGDDYHDVMVERLRALHRWIERELGHGVAGKAYVDTGPVLERDLARRAGLGWFGKNTMLINPRIGSFFFLGELLVDLELTPDEALATDHCGTCRRCLDACPTGALMEPRVIDATRCVSYLTIELKGAIPEELRAEIGELLYGCDVCQEVCPFTRKFSRTLAEPAFEARAAIAGKGARTLARDFLSMSQAEFSASFKGSPMKRAKLRGLKRNSAVVLGNVGSAEDVPSLVAALEDPEPLVRGQAAWALGRIGSPEAQEALRARLLVELDGSVLKELGSAVALADD